MMMYPKIISSHQLYRRLITPKIGIKQKHHFVYKKSRYIYNCIQSHIDEKVKPLNLSPGCYHILIDWILTRNISQECWISTGHFFIEACSKGRLDIIRIYFTTMKNLKHDMLYTSIARAMNNNQYIVVKFLLCNQKYRPRSISILPNKPMKLYKLLYRYQYEIDDFAYASIRHDDIKLCKWVFRTCLPKEPDNLLKNACRNRKDKIFKYILSRINPSMETIYECMALLVNQGNVDMVNVLFDRYPTIDAKQILLNMVIYNKIPSSLRS